MAVTGDRVGVRVGSYIENPKVNIIFDSGVSFVKIKG